MPLIPTPISSNDEIKKALEASGVKILIEETFEKGETDFSGQLTNIMNLDPQPDALFVSALVSRDGAGYHSSG